MKCRRSLIRSRRRALRHALRNPYARALRSPHLRPRVVEDKRRKETQRLLREKEREVD